MPRPIACLLSALLVVGAAGGAGCSCGRRREPPAGPRSHRAPLAATTFELARDGRLALRNLDGPIRVRGGDGAQVRVSGEIEGRSVFPEEARAIARARVIRRGTDADGRAFVEARPPRGRAIGGTVFLEVTVPRGVDLVVEASGRGDVEVEGVVGPLTARALEGAVRLRGVAGAVTAATRRMGPVEVSGAPVEVHVEAAGAARVETTAPRLARDSEVTARRGNAVVVAPVGFAAVVDLIAPRGNTSDDFSLPRADGGVTGATLGGGGARLRVTSRWGDAALRRQ
jgi:hypothetical protein